MKPDFFKSIIAVLVKDNPKRKNTNAFTRFALYKSGMTVDEYIAAGGKLADIKHDVANEFISVTTKGV